MHTSSVHGFGLSGHAHLLPPAPPTPSSPPMPPLAKVAPAAPPRSSAWRTSGGGGFFSSRQLAVAATAPTKSNPDKTETLRLLIHISSLPKRTARDLSEPL